MLIFHEISSLLFSLRVLRSQLPKYTVSYFINVKFHYSKYLQRLTHFKCQVAPKPRYDQSGQSIVDFCQLFNWDFIILIGFWPGAQSVLAVDAKSANVVLIEMLIFDKLDTRFYW